MFTASLHTKVILSKHRIGQNTNSNQPRQTTQTRVYSLTLGNVKADVNATIATTGTIPLLRSIACILFDLGATHSCASFAFMK
jgi:hypothetical protein